MREFFISLTRNAISLIGLSITTASGVLFVTLFAIELAGFLGNPYIGILAYLIVPGIFLIGLLLIPIGIVRERRRVARAREKGEPPPGFPIINLNHEPVRRWIFIFVVLSAVNLVILATATYKGVEVMESTEFCGTACHSVMAPEFAAYQGSPHSRVRCVDCHIGEGADWFVKSKLSGAWQVASVAFELYPRPIPTPVHDLRPARETCEHCHWPEKFVGDRMKVITRFSEDEANTELKTVLLMRVGGIRGDVANGIHWHVDSSNQIRYRSDETRETIYEVELTQADGSITTYYPDGEPLAEEIEGAEWRIMDCVDCHNRPTHVFGLPEQEVDLALHEGRLSASLPFVRREGARLLQEEYDSHEAARTGIAGGIEAFYRDNHPDDFRSQKAAIDQAAQTLGDIYTTNVFPSMQVTWGTYPNHIGHETTEGCFRCHNDQHATADGETISQDCFTCHGLLALEEEDPEILATLTE